MRRSILMWWLFSTLALATIGVPPAVATAAAPSSFDAARFGRALDEYVKPFVTSGELSGQLLVAHHGKIVLERSYGWANAELRVAMSPATRINIASITKPMTMAIALQLMEEKKVGYRDSIARWIPDFPKGDRITIEQLLRHRSGIPHELEPDSEATHPRTAAQMVEIAKRRPLDFDPGTQSNYSTGGFSVLARILEIAGGASYEQLLEKYVFAPAGMTESRHVNAIELLPNRAACYVPVAGGLVNATFQDLSGLVGGGSVWSTARDIHRFVQAVVARRYGEGARQSWVRGGRLDFNGRTSGFRGFATWDSTSDLEFVMLSNVSCGAPDLLKGALRDLAAGRTPAPFARPALDSSPGTAAAMAHAVGDFQLENGTKLHLRVRDGALWCNDWALLPMMGGGFFSPRDYGLVHPVDGADGRVERLDWTQSGQVYPAKRME